MLNKKAELGLKEIVAVVLSIVFLGFGVLFLRQNMVKSDRALTNAVNSEIERVAENKVKESLNSGNKIEISSSVFDLKKGEIETFIVGIKNIEIVEDYFKISINGEGFTYTDSNVMLKGGENKLFNILLDSNKINLGSYNFKIDVNNSKGLYASKDVIVNVR
jgi:hypothetical protein